MKPLNATSGTKNFGGYRDRDARSKRKDEDAMDSDVEEDDEDKAKMDEADADDETYATGKGMLSPEDAMRQGELAEGVRKIKVIQFHSPKT